MQPVTLQQLLDVSHGTAVGIADAQSRFVRIEIDSRRVRHGDLFWAIVGQRDDGHRYVRQALERGALACVVQSERIEAGLQRLVLVEETVLALWDFAEWYRQQSEALVIGVTGTVGKTSTRRMLHRVLSSRFSGVESPENFNNYLGVPLSLLQLEPQHEFAVIELAATRVGDIEDLASIAHPEIGVITAITPVHLDEQGSLDNILRAKGELLEALPPSGFAVLNGDDELVRQLANRAACPVILVGERTDNDVVAEWVRSENGWLRFSVDSQAFDVPVVGRHFITSALMAVAVGRQVDLTDEEIAAGLRMFEPVAGRSELLRIGPWVVINDTYNSSPAALQAACATLRDWQGTGKRILVTGEMLALGTASEEFHRQAGVTVAQSDIQRVITVGSQAASIAGMAKEHGMDAGCLGACADLETVRLLLDCWLDPGDVVLVKGSRATHMEQVLSLLSDLAVSRESLPQRRVA